MKIFKYTIRILLIFLFVAYILPATLLQIPFIQREISNKTTEYLEKKLGTEVHIEDIDFGLFNKLILKNVFLQDQSGDTLFCAKRISAGFEIIPLFKKKLRFNSAQLFTFTLNLSKETHDSPLNIQYIIDAFQSEEPSNNASIDLKIKILNLRSGRFTYRIKDKTPTPGVFNPNDISLKAISAKINLRNFTRDELDIQLNKLSFTEQSGLQLKRLAFEVVADSGKAKIAGLELELPLSKLKIANIEAVYNKEAFDKMPFHLSIEPSGIYPKDFSSIVPVFTHYNDKIFIQGYLSGTLSDFSFTDFLIQDKKAFFVQADGRIQNITASNPDMVYVESKIDKSTFNILGVQKIIADLSEEKTVLPQTLLNLKNILFSGDITGNINNLHARGDFDTDAGNLHTDIIIGKKQTSFIEGEISTSGLNLKLLTGDDSFGQTVFKINLHATPDHLSGRLNALVNSFEYKGYKYENGILNGDFTSSGFTGTLNIDDLNGKLALKGSFLLNGNNSEFNFTARASDIRLDKLNLTEKYRDPRLSFVIDAGFTGNGPDNLAGNLSLHNLFFSTDKGDYTMDKLNIKANMRDTIKEIKIASDIINGEIKGVFSLKNSIPELKQALSFYLPSLFPKKEVVDKNSNTDFAFNFILNNNENLTSILEFPVTFYSKTYISGSYNNRTNQWNVGADIPFFKASGIVVEGGTLKLKNQDDYALLELKGTFPQKKSTTTMDASFVAKDNSIHSLLSWNSVGAKMHKGKFEFTTALSGTADNRSLTADIDIKRSQLIFNDSVWTLFPTTITANANKIEIDGCKFQHDKQFVEIKGNISHNPDEFVKVDLNQVDLSYIFQTLNIKALDFGGIATGQVFAKDVYNTHQLTTNLDVTDFAFNQVVFGHLLLDGTWDDAKQGIKMTGNVFKNDTTSVAIDGMIYPVSEELSISFDAKNANAAFLRKYLNKVVQDFSGQATGLLTLVGDLNHPTIEGAVDVKNGGFRIGFLNTYYTFSDRVVCTRNSISIDNLALYDENRNKATATGHVHHKQFNDFQFFVNIDFDDFMVFNATKATNQAFFGTAYGKGKATLRGTEDLININVSMQNTENSKMTLNFMDEINVAEYNFIRFINKEKDSIPVSTLPYLPIISDKPIFIENDSKTEIRLALSLGITPGATIDLIMNPLSGDKINAYGSGHLDIQYGTSIPLKVMGNYTIEKGKYNFSLQQVLLRNFDIRDGSVVAFKGNPYTAELNLNAAYTVSANLGDLDEQLFQLSARNNVPVNCVLLLKGPLNHPNIAFDMDLPGSTSELTRQVKSYIRTDDMMNRQILYLLILGRFYTSPEYARSDSRINNDLSFLTNTLSSQLSSILGNLSDNFQIGTTFHQAYEGERSNTEVELLLSSTLLNNRLTINGNFGYINNQEPNALQNSNSPVVGDLDVEYKLTPSGNIRLKGFNRYNYRNYYSNTPELTQGVGILFRKDFNHLRDLVGRKKEEEEVTNKE
jgi:hypothetical protein